MGQNIVLVRSSANVSNSGVIRNPLASPLSSPLVTRRSRGLITFMGRLVNQSLRRGRATVPREKRGREGPEGRESPEKGTGVNYSARPFAEKKRV